MGTTRRWPKCQRAGSARSRNAQWFVDGKFRVMHHERGPVSRVYATVLQPGVICQGDAAILEP